jgi:hypothetical protein
LFFFLSLQPKIPFSFCAELWGGPQHPNCFVQFNPHPAKLKEDLERIRPYYIESLLALLDETRGWRFVPTLSVADDDDVVGVDQDDVDGDKGGARGVSNAVAARQLLDDACKVEQKLRELEARLRRRSGY